MSVSESFFLDIPVGFIVFDSNGKVLLYELFKGDVEHIVDNLLKLESGEFVDELKSLCDRINSMGIVKILFDSEKLIPMVRKLIHKKIELYLDPENLMFKKLRNMFPEILVSTGFVSSVKDYYELIHDISMAISRRKLRKAVEKKDLILAQSINAVDDINKIVNMMATRLREWYGVHFPELNSIIDDHMLYAKIVGELGLRSNFVQDKIVNLGISKDSADKIINATKSSIGAEISEHDINVIKNFAKTITKLYEIRSELEEYIDYLTDDVCPNLKALVGSLVSARLISLAGGLDKLSRLPSSTIQVLGAEKALFRSLRTGTKPPKHGVIFQCQEVHGAPKWQRGKIARALAGKISIAARVDAFSGVYIGDELKKDLYDRIEEIKRLYPKPTKKHIEVKGKKFKRRR